LHTLVLINRGLVVGQQFLKLFIDTNILAYYNVEYYCHIHKGFADTLQNNFF